jgi:hypothetical protein
MLNEKKKIDVELMRVAGCLNQGGKITLPEEDDEETGRGIPGIDYPVGEENIGF